MKRRKWQMIEGIELQIEEKSDHTEQKGNLQLLRHIGSEHYQTSEDERKD